MALRYPPLRTAFRRRLAATAERWRKGRSRSSERLEDYEALLEQRLEHCVPVDQPLCLISQAARSGGSLLSQLFDGDPAVHTHPWEVQLHRLMRHAEEFEGPVAPWYWLGVVRSGRLPRWFKESYAKDKRSEAERHPFAVPPSLHRDLFMALAEARTPRTHREVLDLYFTSFFNAWLDYRNLHTRRQSWIVGFQPRLATEIDKVHRHFAYYPEGRLISVIRDPASWYASASRKSPRYADEAKALGLWERGARTMIEARSSYGEQVRLLTFEDLLTETDRTMRGLADWLGIEFSDALLAPTFNGWPIGANSSFIKAVGKVATEPLGHAQFLAEDQRARIERAHRPLYERVAEFARAQ